VGNLEFVLLVTNDHDNSGVNIDDRAHHSVDDGAQRNLRRSPDGSQREGRRCRLPE
jgi:hypothetical protein